MRLLLLASVALLSGCKTLELAVTHPTTGIHIVARMENQEPVISNPLPGVNQSPLPAYAFVAR